MHHHLINRAMFAPSLRALLTIIVCLLPLVASAQALRVVARVNDDAITDFELAQRVVFAIRTTGLQDSPDMRQRLAAQVLRQMVDERLQIQDARRLGLRATDTEINQRIGDLERSSGLGRGQFKQVVTSWGVPYEIVTQQIEASISWTKVVRRRVRSQVEVSENEIDEAFGRMQGNIGKTESRVLEIFVPIDRVDQADEAKRSADRIVEQLRRGAPFPAVAQQFSQGATAQSGGDIGWIFPGSLDPTLDAALARLQPRQHSEPIRTAAGWHILYVADRRVFAAARPDDTRLNLVQMTLALPINASAEETNRATRDAQAAMAGVRQCGDLHVQARGLKGATTGDLNGVRVGDLIANREMYDALPRLQPGQAGGPFRVAEGLQVVALCSREGGQGLPARDAVGQQLLLQKLEAASRRYMRELRRTATIEYRR
jgi:peptidyl-prolyl cis-trans isomerase SurA